MRKSLFNEFEATNEDGNRVSNEFSAALRPLLDRWNTDGYSLRDVHSILDLAVSNEISWRILSNASKIRNNQKEKKNLYPENEKRTIL